MFTEIRRYWLNFVWIFCGFVESLNLFSSTIMKSRNSGKVSAKWVPIFSIAFFFIGMLFTNRFFNLFFFHYSYLIWLNFDSLDLEVDLSIFCRFWTPPETGNQLISQHRREQELQIISEDCTAKKKVWFCIEFFKEFWNLDFPFSFWRFNFFFLVKIEICGGR